MKRQILLVVCLLSGISVFAQTYDAKWAVGVGSGVYGTLERGGVGYMPELTVSRYISPSFDVFFTQNLGLFRSDVISNLDVAQSSLNARYKFSNGIVLSETTRLQPYAFAGLGYLNDNKVNSVNGLFGGGAKFGISKRISLYAHAGIMSGAGVKTVNLDPTTLEPEWQKYRDNLWSGIVGIEIALGGSKDSDHDGVPDKRDKCPNTKRDVFVDEHGCPIDSDGDGVIDHLDNCPTVAGSLATDGCPDGDGDGVPDKDDQCPDVKGKKEFNGCPDPKEKSETAQRLEPSKMTAEQALQSGNTRVLDIKVKSVYFVVDQSYLTDYSKNKIANMVDMLLKNPAYLVRLWGYTDDLASAEYNQTLSEKRAESVVTFMTSMGFSRDRIVAVDGMGEANPAAPNNSEQNRKLNRRVEFEIFVAE